MEKLNKNMQERLEKWRKKLPPTVVPEKTKKPVMQNFIARKEYGDDCDQRDNNAWNQEFKNNPIYRSYR